MGGLGVSVRNQVYNLIRDTNLRSELTLTPKTITTGSLGGYETNTETSGTSRTVYCIPSNYTKIGINMEKFGDLKSGEVRFLVNYDEVIDTADLVTFNGQEFSIRELRNIYFNEVVVAQSLTLSKRID